MPHKCTAAWMQATLVPLVTVQDDVQCAQFPHVEKAENGCEGQVQLIVGNPVLGTGGTDVAVSVPCVTVVWVGDVGLLEGVVKWDGGVGRGVAV